MTFNDKNYPSGYLWIDKDTDKELNFESVCINCGVSFLSGEEYDGDWTCIPCGSLEIKNKDLGEKNVSIQK